MARDRRIRVAHGEIDDVLAGRPCAGLDRVYFGATNAMHPGIEGMEKAGSALDQRGRNTKKNERDCSKQSLRMHVTIVFIP
jgi:hypothetical protein